LLYDRLIQLTPNSQGLAPMLATSWKWNSTNTQLTFMLRKGVMFQDGEAFNADDVVANLQAAAAKGSNGQAALADMTDVVAVDPYTVRLTFKTPEPSAIFTFAYFPGMMVSPNGLAHPSMLKTQPMGSGPYKLASVSSALTFDFDRFGGYWNTTHVYPAHVRALSLVDANATVNSVTTGVSDIANIPVANLPSARADKSLQFATYQSQSVQSIFMNNTVAPLDNTQVREAVSLALNREAFNQADSGACLPVDQAFQPGMVGYIKGYNGLGTDVTKAKQLIESAGAKGATIKMITIPNQPYLAWAEVAQSQLDAIGLNIQLSVFPGTVYRSQFAGGGYGMIEAGLLVSVNDPSQIVSQFVLGSGNPGTKDPTLVAAINQAQQMSLGTPERAAAFSAINRDLTTKYLLWAPECLPTYTFAGSKKLIGLNAMPDAFSAVPDLSYLQVTK
jgi:peptide/nickel transport system substrate-binding protein